MSTTQAKIAAKKLTEESGVPDALADQMFNLQSGHWVAIVDLAHLDRTEGREGKQIARLEIGQLEILTGDAADHARELMRSVYLARQPRGLDQVDEDDADEIIRRGRSVLLTCQTCLHPTTEDRISHYQGDNPNDENAWCTWNDDGTQVYTDDDPDQHGEPASALQTITETVTAIVTDIVEEALDADDQAASTDLTGSIPVGADA